MFEIADFRSGRGFGEDSETYLARRSGKKMKKFHSFPLKYTSDTFIKPRLMKNS